MDRNYFNLQLYFILSGHDLDDPYSLFLLVTNSLQGSPFHDGILFLSPTVCMFTLDLTALPPPTCAIRLYRRVGRDI